MWASASADFRFEMPASDKDPSAAAAANRLLLEGEATTDNLTCINSDKRKGTERKGGWKDEEKEDYSRLFELNIIEKEFASRKN